VWQRLNNSIVVPGQWGLARCWQGRFHFKQFADFSYFKNGGRELGWSLSCVAATKGV
jgi:hypothetical protein